MLRTLYRSARLLSKRFINHVGPSPHIIHSLPTEEEFFHGLTINFSPKITTAHKAFSTGERATALKCLSSHFRSRSFPRFFIDSDEIGSAIVNIAKKHPNWRDSVLLEADKLEQGYLSVYAIEAMLASQNDWNSIPLGPGQDILYRERPHRFGFVPRLALAALHGHGEAIPTLERFLQGWATSVQSPTTALLLNRNFEASSHVALYRVTAISWALAFLAANNTVNSELEFLLLRILYGDARYIHKCLPETTANNHLLADGFALWYLALLFPEFAPAAEWHDCGHPVFVNELKRQIYRDGTSFEQSIHYQEHACEMAAAYLLLSERNNYDVESGINEKMKAMLSFQSSVAGRDGYAFGLGDTTEDPLFPLDGDDGWCGPALSILSRIIFNDISANSDFSSASLERAFWLAAGNLPPENKSSQKCTLSVFPQGGFAFFTGQAKKTRLLFRTGPAEQLELVPGHMHADYLSIYLVVEGKAILIPSGTYTYRSDPIVWPRPYAGWREYFLSPQASNGLVLSNTDLLQRTEGDFPGGIKGSIASRVRTDPAASSKYLNWLSGRVTGESSYSGWVRGVLQVLGDYWLVIDRLPTLTTRQSISARFQFAPSSRVNTVCERSIQIECGHTQILMAWSHTLGEPLHLEGSRSPMGGWVAPAYGILKAAPQLQFPADDEARITMMALGIKSDGCESLSIKQTSENCSCVTVEIRYGQYTDYLEVPLAHSESTGDGQIKFQRHEDTGKVVTDKLIIAEM